MKMSLFSMKKFEKNLLAEISKRQDFWENYLDKDRCCHLWIPIKRFSKKLKDKNKID